MEETIKNNDMISQSKAEELAGTYLKKRYYNYDKIEFTASEHVMNNDLLIYRFGGLIIEKPKALIDLLARDKSSVTYKFVIDISSKNGRVLNYVLT